MSREQRIYAMRQAMRRDRGYAYDHYRKGYIKDGPYMIIARKFKIPIQEVKRIIAQYKEDNNVRD